MKVVVVGVDILAILQAFKVVLEVVVDSIMVIQ